MNSIKRLVIIQYCVILSAILIYVPWVASFGGFTDDEGYAFLFNKPCPICTIDIAKLAIEVILLTAVSAICYLLVDPISQYFRGKQVGWQEPFIMPIMIFRYLGAAIGLGLVIPWTWLLLFLAYEHPNGIFAWIALAVGTSWALTFWHPATKFYLEHREKMRGPYCEEKVQLWEQAASMKAKSALLSWLREEWCRSGFRRH